MDDLYLAATSAKDLEMMTRQVASASQAIGLALQPTKRQWANNLPDHDEFAISVHGRLVPRCPREDGFQVLGTQLTLDGKVDQEWAIRTSKAWKAFWANYQMRLRERY